MPNTTSTATEVQAANQTEALTADQIEQQIRERIDGLNYLPTTAAVALKFIELGKNLNAEPADYAKVISADSSLSSKLLALANSSWAGVRTKVTNVKMAVNLLGLGTVRTLAISYCMTGLHNELRLSKEESRQFWEPSLCKAVAAKKFAALFDKSLGDEAFASGLFQDFAVSLMYSIQRESYLELLGDTRLSAVQFLEKEREMFRLDHTEVGRMLAQKLELPSVFVDGVAFHHSHERLSEFVEQQAVRDAAFAASLLPHILSSWSSEDANALEAFLREHANGTDLQGYLAAVQEEYEQLYGFFHQGEVPDTKLAQLLEDTAKEMAENTTALVGTVNELMQSAATMGTQVSQLVRELEDEVAHDKLTGVYTREGFGTRAEEMLRKVARNGVGFAMAYLDVDGFKSVNDTHGHHVGDQALQFVTSKMRESLPEDALLGRMGGDEFVILLGDATEAAAKECIQHLVAMVAAKPPEQANAPLQLGLSAGLLYIMPTNEEQNLEMLIKAADKLMYLAKRGGGGRVEYRGIGAAAT